MNDQHKYKNFISEIPSTAVDVYRMLPEGTRCEVIFNELFFPDNGHKDEKYDYFPWRPTTAIEVYQMLPEGTRCEVIFNTLVMSPSPTFSHQQLLADLHAILYLFLKDQNLGKAILSPFDVYIENHDSVVQPDLIIILNENLHLIQDNGFHGAPDIAIEILSPNRAYDTKRKRALYEKGGVKEYFMIDPENKKTVLLTLNSAGVYEQTYEETGMLRSQLLQCSFSF
jgi:Uma2 family endonuclease